MVRISRRAMTLRCGVATWAIALAGPALAQTTNTTDAPTPVLAQPSGLNVPDNADNSADIVVTGTLIRGKAPTGGELGFGLTTATR